MNQRPGLYISDSDDKGRGVFTSEHIPAAEIIEICHVIVVPRAEVPVIHKTVLHDYYFLWGEDMEDAAIALGFGSLYNHAVHSNADFILDIENGTIDIVAVEDIAAGSEITINYHGERGDETPLWF